MNMQEIINEVKALANEVREYMRDYPNEEMSDYVFEICDGHEWIIYYHHAWDLCHTSRGVAWLINPAEDYMEDLGGLTLDKGIDGAMCQLAFAILYCAVTQELAGEFVD